jgi:hypothetical protein
MARLGMQHVGRGTTVVGSETRLALMKSEVLVLSIYHAATASCGNSNLTAHTYRPEAGMDSASYFASMAIP